MATGDGQYKIKIETEANLKGATDLGKALDSNTQKAKQLTTATSAQAQSTTKAAQATQAAATAQAQATQSTTKATQATEAKAGALQRLATRLVTVAAAYRIVRGAIAEYVANEQSAAGLDAALAQRSQLTDRYRESLLKLADALSARTGKQGSEWVEALTTLTKFGAEEGNIQALAKGVEDLAGVMGGSLGNAATAIGKAMNGQTAALTRYGFTIDETKSKQEQLNSLLAQFAERGGGQLEARTKTLTGEFQKFTMALGNFGSGLVGAFAKLEIGQTIFSKIAGWLNVAAEAFQGTIPKIQGMENATASLDSALEDLEDDSTATASAIDKIKKAADEAAQALDREREAMRDVSNHTVNMIEANAKLEKAKVDNAVRLGQLTPQQGAMRKADIDRRREQGVFAEQQRSRMAIAATADIERGQIVGEISGRQTDLDQRRNRAVQATQARQRVTQLESQLEDLRTNDPTQDQQLPVFGNVGLDQLVTPEQIATVRAERANQIARMESELNAARAASAPFANDPASGMMAADVRRRQNELNAFRDVQRPRIGALEQTITNSNREAQQSAGIFGVESQANALDRFGEVFGSGSGQAPTNIVQQNRQQGVQIMQQVIEALRARDAETAQAFLGLLNEARASRAEIARLKQAVEQVRRANGNRTLLGG